LTVIDIRKSSTAWFSNFFLQPKPNTEILLLAGMLKYIIEKEQYDRNFLEKRVKGLKPLKDFLAKLSLEKVSEATGISQSVVVKIAEGLVKASKPHILYTASVLRYGGSDVVKALANMALLTCLPKDGGLITLEGPLNAQGAKDLLSEGPDLQNARFLLFLGDFPDGLKLRNVEFMVSTQQFKFEESVDSLPDLVIPTACWAEKEGSLTSADRLVRWLEKAVKPPGNVKADFHFLLELAGLLGVNLPYQEPEDVWEDLRRLLPAYRNLSPSSLKANPERWGGDSLFKERFATRNGLRGF
jgi:formate dehydrogenase major subunit